MPIGGGEGKEGGAPAACASWQALVLGYYAPLVLAAQLVNERRQSVAGDAGRPQNTAEMLQTRRPTLKA